MFLGGPVIWVYAVEFGLGRVDSDESVCTFRSKQYQVTRHVPCGVELRFIGSKLVMTEHYNHYAAHHLHGGEYGAIWLTR